MSFILVNISISYVIKILQCRIVKEDLVDFKV